jgi:hypothetical protein
MIRMFTSRFTRCGRGQSAVRETSAGGLRWRNTCPLVIGEWLRQANTVKRGWHRLGWGIANCAMVVCCHAAPPPRIDSFLILSPPALVGNQVEFTLTGEADVPYVVETSSDTTHWLAVVTNTSPEITRSIVLDAPTNDMTFYRAWREPQPMFLGALVARSSITMSGNDILVDSYDSGDPNHADPWGQYDPNTRKAGGDVFSAEGFISVGNADIKGKLFTSPLNVGQYSLGPGSSVGDLAWSGPGIQAGRYLTNFHWALPDVPPPFQTGLPPASAGTANLWDLVSASYMHGDNFSASSSETIHVAGNATLYVTGSFNFPGTINIAPGGSLKLYVGGTNTHLGRVINPGTAFHFQYYGLPANTNITWAGNSNYVGTIYAPQAALSLASSGAGDFQGACVVKSADLSGAFGFHFDENLKRKGPKR